MPLRNFQINYIRTSNIKQSLSNLIISWVESFKERSKPVLCLLLVMCLLTMSSPAAPKIAKDGILHWQQNIIIAATAGGWRENVIHGINNLFYSDTSAQTTQDSRNSEVVRIETDFPEEIAVGGHIQLEAIPYDYNDVPVSGIRLEWEIEDPDGQSQTSLHGLYTAQKVGQYKITATGADKQKISYLSSVESSDFKNNSSRKNEGSAESENAPNQLTPIPYQQWESETIEYAEEPENGRGETPGKPKVNNNFNISAPVLAVSGRAGLDLNLNLTYNSRVWTKMGQNISFDIDKDLPAPGWSIGFGKILNFVDGGIVQFDGDGSKRFFNGSIKTESNKKIFEGQSTDGSFIKTQTVTTGGVVSGQVCYSNATTLLKHPDGTTITYAAYDIPYPGCGVPSGTPITMVPYRITDKHGNYISIVYHASAQDGRFISYVKDTLGRIYNFNYTQIDTKHYLTSITGPGLKDANGVITQRTFVRLNYKNHTLGYQFNNLTPQVNNSNIKVLSAIYYPATNTGYWFGDPDAYSSYGMVRKIEEQKGMGFDSIAGNISSGQITRRRVYSYPENASTPINDIPEYTTVTETWDGMPDLNSPAVTQYIVDWTSSPRTTTIIAPYQQGKTIEYSYKIALDTSPDKPKDGITFKTEFYDGNNVLRTRDEIDWGIGSLTFSAHNHAASYNLSTVRPASVTHSEFENGITLTKKSVYDQYGAYNRVEQMHETGYNGETLRTVKTQYIDKGDNITTDSAWWSDPRLTNLPTITEVFDSNNNRIDYTQLTYDEVALPITSPAPPNFQGDPSCPPAGGCPSQFMAQRGNLSNVIKYSKVTNSSLDGQVVDGRLYSSVGNIVSYNPSTTGVNLEYYTFTPNNAYAYLEETIRGHGGEATSTLKTSSIYDFNTGLPLSATDANQQTTQLIYDLQTWQLKKIILPTGAYTTNDYDDFNRVYTQTDYTSAGAIAGKQIVRVNGLGLPYRQESLSGADQAVGDVWDVVETAYDNLGRTKKTSNPFRSNENTHGVYWSEAFYDWAGRIEKTKSPDGSEKFNYYNESIRPQHASVELGETFRTKDPIGREKWHRTDSNGNVVEVVEPAPEGSGAVNTGGLLTKYQYDKLGRLIRTEQGAQERRFKYDSLGRLTHQKMAETKATLNESGTFVGEATGQWSDFFVYDGISSISSNTDARGVKTIYSYANPATSWLPRDPLNRLFSASYETNSASNVLPSPTIKYTYQPSGNVSQIKSIYTESTVAGNTERHTTNDFSYDTYGRTSEKKTTLASRPAYPMTTNYSYDSLSRITDVYYPAQYGITNSSGSNPRKNVHNNYDSVGRLNGLKVDNSDYASNFVFNAADQITSVKIGSNGANQISEQYNYNPQTSLLENQKVLRGSTTLLDLSYGYQRCSCSTGGTGQITGITNNLDRNKDRVYEYDKLGRLKKVTGGINQTWSQMYTFDRYGNRSNVTSLGVESLRAVNKNVKNKDEQERILKESVPVASLPTSGGLLENVKNLVKDGQPENLSDSPVSLYKQTEETTDTNSNKTDKNESLGEKLSGDNINNAAPEKSEANQPNSITATIGTPFDFNGDGKADFSTWRKTTGSLTAGSWVIRNSQTGQNTTAQLGAGGNQIAPGDYDGDGKTDKAIWNPSNGVWTIQYSSTGNTATQTFGQKGDAITPGDYDGDGKTDIAVWRPSTGYWYISKSSDNSWSYVRFGGQQYGDIPTVGDYDGDGKSDIAVWRPSTYGIWYVYVLQSSSYQLLYFQWGQTGDVPVVADYDGDNKSDLAVWRPSTGVWHISRSSDGQYAHATLGSEASRDILVPADYDGDGNADMAVWTPSAGTWTVKQSTTGTNITHQLGTKDDVAVPSAYIRRSSAPNAQSSEIPRDGHESLTFESTSNRITTTGFEYDAAGNQTRIVQQNGSALRFQYDAAGRLVKVKNDNQQTLVTHTYGIGRERLITQEGDETSNYRTYYAWEGGAVISEYIEGTIPNSLSWTKNYIYMGGALLATQNNTGNSESVQFDHPDQLGTRVITDPGNGTSFEQNNLPFGTGLESESTGTINTRFRTYDRSSSTGLDYAVNRFYDSSQGRFTTVDPIKMGAFKALNPQTLNLYAYCSNDPINKTDPSGLDWSFLNGGATNATFSVNNRWGMRLPGSSGNSLLSGLGQFLTGFLGNIFGGGRDYAGAIVAATPYNTGVIRAVTPPPLPGNGTIVQTITQKFVPPPPKELRKTVQDKYGKKFGECLRQELTRWAKKQKFSSRQALAEYLEAVKKMGDPDLTAVNIYNGLTSKQLAEKFKTGYVVKGKFIPVEPYAIPEVTTTPFSVRIASQPWNNPNDWKDNGTGRTPIENAFIHEAGNLASHAYTGSFYGFGDPNATDPDSGYTIQKCVFGN